MVKSSRTEKQITSLIQTEFEKYGVKDEIITEHIKECDQYNLLDNNLPEIHERGLGQKIL